MADNYVVRYGRMRFLGECAGLPGQNHPRGQTVVIRSDRGTELGEVLCAASERTARYLPDRLEGEILRLPTDEDRERQERNAQELPVDFDVCRDLIARRKLQMDLIDVEILHGRERVVFYYLAEKRVDFRELVKDLARAMRTRIEMRQIGVRDEAKLVADYGDCGKPVCCNTHLSRMPPVSMKMAKLQKTTLDPSKISGRCGRLKCCLRYEYDTYRELEKMLPPNGSTVVTSVGRGRVVGQEILAQKLVVEFDDQRRVIVALGDVLHVEPSRGRGPAPAGRNARGETETETETESETETETGALRARLDGDNHDPELEDDYPTDLDRPLERRF